MKPHTNILLFIAAICGFYNTNAQHSKNYWQKNKDNKYITTVKVTEYSKMASREDTDTIRYSFILSSNKPKIDPKTNEVKKIWADGRAYYYSKNRVYYRFKDTGTWQPTQVAVKKGEFPNELMLHNASASIAERFKERLKDVQIDSVKKQIKGNSKYKSDNKWREIIYYNQDFLKIDSLIEIYEPNDYSDKVIYNYEYLTLDSNFQSSQFKEQDFFSIFYPNGTQRKVMTNAPETINQNQIDSIITTNKLTLIDFWYLSCAPCLKTSPLIEKLHQQFNDSNLKVIGIDPFDKQLEIDGFILKKNSTYKSFANKTAIKKYNIAAYPTILLIDSKGNIIFRSEGFDSETYDSIMDIVKKY